MRKLLRVGKDVKARRARVKELMNLKIGELETDPKLQLIQELIPLGLLHVRELLTEEVQTLAGERYKRKRTPVMSDGQSSGVRSTSGSRNSPYATSG